jgi:hypothetical protein
MERKLKRIHLTVVLLLIHLLLFSQNPSRDSGGNSSLDETEVSGANTFPEPTESKEVFALPLSRLEFQLSIFILGFGIILILLEIYLVRNKNISGEDTIKFIVITIIIISTLFLITAGYSNDQIAPAVGLLGTIAGYLLGRMNSTNKNDNEKA